VSEGDTWRKSRRAASRRFNQPNLPALLRYWKGVCMAEKVITSNSEQVLTIKWDGERFSLIELDREKSKVIILNPREMMEIIMFGGTLGKD